MLAASNSFSRSGRLWLFSLYSHCLCPDICSPSFQIFRRADKNGEYMVHSCDGLYFSSSEFLSEKILPNVYFFFISENIEC